MTASRHHSNLRIGYRQAFIWQMTSHELFQSATRVIPGGVNSPVRAFRGVGGEPFFVSRAEGSRIFTVDGRELIDYVGTWGPAILGHAPDAVVAAVCGAASKGLSFGIPNPLEVKMAEMICSLVPSIERVRMVNSGTEATMSCIRLARGFTKRNKIIKFEGCYHGHVDSLLVKAGSGALTHGQPDSAGVPASLADLTVVLPFNDLDAVEEALRANQGQVAAIILEPVPANAGLYLPEPGFLEGLRAQCNAEEVLLIFDEVMTGFRLSPGGAQELYNVRPDLTALGKVIGGGLPVGAFGGRAEIMEQLSPDGPVYQAGTLSGNPIALAAGLAQINELIQRGGWSRLGRTGGNVRKRNPRRDCGTANHLSSPRFHVLPLLLRRTCSQPHGSRSRDRQRFARYFHACLDGGVYFAPSQFEAGFLSLAHSEADIEQSVRVAAAAVKTAG